MKRRFYKGVAAALGGALLWGFSGNCIQALTGGSGFDPLLITLVRAIVAAFALLGASFIRYRSALGGIWRDGKARLWIGMFGIALFLSQGTYAISVEHTNAGTATVLQSLATVFVLAITCIMGRRLPRKLEVVGLACAVLSTWLIATQGDPLTLSLPLGGVLWGLVNALSVAVYLVCPQRLYERWPSIPVIASGVAASAGFAILVYGAKMALAGDAAIPLLDTGDMLLLVGGIGLLGTACAFGLYLYGVSIVGSVNGSLLGTAEPASAMVIMVLWLGTAVSVADWLGLVLMMGMIVAVAKSAPEPEEAAKDARTS